MHKVRIENKRIEAEDGSLLSELLIRNKIEAEHPCGGMGTCKKCQVLVNGREELSCRYRIHSDVTVVLQERGKMGSVTGAETDSNRVEHRTEGPLCLVLDLGTTTLALAVVDLSEKKVVKVLTATNPQRMFGADVISRIAYCRKHSVEHLQEVLLSEINRLLFQAEFRAGMPMAETLFVAGNVTMLHMLFGEDCSSLGEAPYTPVFLESRETTGTELGIPMVERILSLPSVSAFVGADLVAGLNLIGLPPEHRYYLLVDLGTNAEIVLLSQNGVVCTSAAAGPCFEGANISCGMSATPGAIASFALDSQGNPQFETINGAEPKGICGTGLVDLIAVLYEAGIIDETGYMECEEYPVAEGVVLTQEDVRQYQLAKSAVCSAIQTLIRERKVPYEQIEKLYISGGFSAKINIQNAGRTGLFPGELLNRCETINNSSLLGAVRFACERNDLSVYLSDAEYVDLSANVYFAGLFMENMKMPS